MKRRGDCKQGQQKVKFNNLIVAVKIKEANKEVKYAAYNRMHVSYQDETVQQAVQQCIWIVQKWIPQELHPGNRLN